MKSWVIYIVLWLLCTALIGCQYETPKEAINSKFDQLVVNDVIDKQKIDDESTIAFFSARDNEATNAFETIGVAVVEQGNLGWKLIKSSSGTAENVPFSVGHEVFFVEDEHSHVQKIPIAYGKISDEKITSIDAKVKDETKEIEIHTTPHGRYFFETNAWGPIRALNENGEVIDQYQ